MKSTRIQRIQHARVTLLATLLLIAACFVPSPASAHSTRLAPHKRAHVPQNIKYTLVRRQTGQTSSRNRHEQAKRAAIVNSPFGGGSNYASKRSSPPAPFAVLDGASERPQFDDTIFMQFEVPSDDNDHTEGSSSERISMLLRPNEEIVSEGARVVYINTDPLTGETYENVHPLHRPDVLAYTGYVLQEGEEAARLNMERIGLRHSDEEAQSRGWARIVLSRDESGDRTLAEGAFTLDGETHHLKTVQNWDLTRHEDEPRLQARHYQANEGLVLLRDRDLSSGAFNLDSSRQSKRSSSSSSSSGCSHDSLAFNQDFEHPVYKTARQQAFDAMYSRQPSWLDGLLGVSPELPHYARNYLDKRQSGGDLAGGGNMSSNYINSIGSTTGCPKSAQVLYMGFAADCTYVAKYGGADNARTQILTNLNTVSALYQRTFNVSLGAVEFQVVNGSCPSAASSSLAWNTACPSSSSSGSSSSALSLNARLSAFSQWRGNKGGSDGAGLWHLLTDCNDGSEVGVAWLGTLCRVSTSTSSDGEITSGTGVTSSTSREWQVMAHEIGHNFGAIHDCTDGCSLSQSCCPLSRTTCDADAAYIMSPVSERNTTTFSPCSIGNICSALGTTLNTTCLYAPGNREVISLQQCGNGILEPGEECDPGQGASSDCCDSSTCKLRSGAQCDPATNTCCSSSCTYAPSGQVCRPAVTETCDIAETCTGTSADCPPDETKPDGTSCGSNGLKCASGYCTSKDEQCASLGASMGITQACPNVGDSSCEVTCQSPNSALSCIILQGQYFTEGTECGYGGHCRDGKCQSGSWQDTVASWYRDNLRISLPVTIIGGIIVLLILFGIIRCCFRRCSSGSGRKKAASSRYASTAPIPHRQSQQNQGPYMSQGPPGNSFASNQPIYPSYPQYQPPAEPYPTYGGYNNQYGNGNGGWR
ncbi:hypothetical protein P389DRAFT_210806 [Cystobasidium minutum MCA 4210]|uniref:uncharacterized protein n=1 Tax=Cystobasidium minutum MCA 4210 TaxID=1397322 RepID=UPI0034CEE8BC|eukprot:jgi/Rhomi1/210806/estExt_Genemark1.C_4_t10381